MTVTRAMLLAAGKGERLRPLTARTPKPLVPVGGRPMVHYVLDRLAAAGIREVHVNTHHLGERLAEALGDGSEWGIALCYHPEPTILGTGGGLLAVCRACPELCASDFLMINSDILIDLDLKAVLAAHAAHAPLATLVLREDPAAARYGVIGADGDGRIRRFLEVNAGGATRECMFTGVQVLAPGIVKYLEAAAAGVPDGVFPVTDPYKAALTAGAELRAHLHTGYWADLGTPERLGAAEADLAAGRAGGLPPVSDTLTGLGLGALASLCWGIADFIARGAVRKAGDAYTLLVVLTVGGLGIAVYVLPGGIAIPAGAPLGLLAATALLALGGYLALYRAFKVGMLSVVSPIAAANAVIPVALALAVLGERPLPLQLGGVVLVLAGVLLLGVRGRLPLPTDTQRLGITPALVCMVLFGLSLFGMKLAVDRVAPGTVALAVRVIGAGVLGAWLAAVGGLKVPPAGVRGALVAAGLLDAAAFVCFCEALTHTLLSLVAPIASTIPVVTVALARVVLHERLARPQQVGLALAVGGLVLVAVV